MSDVANKKVPMVEDPGWQFYVQWASIIPVSILLVAVTSFLFLPLLLPGVLIALFQFILIRRSIPVSFGWIWGGLLSYMISFPLMAFFMFFEVPIDVYMFELAMFITLWGFLTGLFQWFAIRKLVRKAGQWIAGCTLGYLLMGIVMAIFGYGDILAYYDSIVISVLGMLLALFIPGLITGPVMVKLISGKNPVKIEESTQKIKNLGLLPMRHADLEGKSFAGQNLDGVDFRNANLVGADLRRVSMMPRWAAKKGVIWAILGIFALGETELKGWRPANLSNADLSDANLEGAEMNEAIFEYTTLDWANLSYTSLQGAVFLDAEMQGVDLQHAFLDNAVMCRANLEGAKLRHATFDGADLEGANLNNADLTGVDLSKTHLVDTTFENAIIEGTKFPWDDEELDN